MDSWEETQVLDLDGNDLLGEFVQGWEDPERQTELALIEPGWLLAHQTHEVLKAWNLSGRGELCRLHLDEYIQRHVSRPTYICLADGYILFHTDRAIVTWNPKTGDHVRLPLDSDGRTKTEQLSDLSCLTQLESGELIHWCPKTGALHARGTLRELLYDAPNVVATWLSRRAPHQVRGGTTVVADREGLVVRYSSGAIAEWHASGDWTVHGIEDDGRIIVTGGTSVLVLSSI